MRRAELVTAVVLAAFSIYLMWKSTELNIGWVEYEGPGGGAWPFWLAAVMLVCNIWTIVNWVRKATPQSRSVEQFMDAHAIRMFVLVGGSVVALVAMVHFIGVYGAVPVFLLFYLRVLGRHTWRLTVPVAVSAPVVIFFFFDVAMRIVLPKGYLEPLFYPLYDIFL
ncbi:tripartite tricarboxylate transporter TctB family protein [Nisaea acidiphila]|uniref:Tripartite tricarboxylate transporter TctB family protein n=1 Tax=Nisaea acidiphila TaxID=1862145 RepID=A0A9J7AT40_9PROT|nr:tripartite tricarboxylate transporter TctB family protein [Nisaea acidiphila]UUX50342.1 tripartite tricarboxylate transporter TctB family protein [Nisaea acidiphila]